MKLGDIGEFGILRHHLIPSLGDVGRGLGDDCTILGLADDISLVITSDRGVKPLAWSIEGMPVDFADAGWLAVVASASDLATAGAKPFAITNDIEAPSTMLVEDLNRYVMGVAEACRAFQFRHAGGDLASSDHFTTHCTAIGVLHGKYRVGRYQCRPGDYVLVLGPMGALASAYLHARREGPQALSSAERSALLRPTPQLDVMQTLVSQGLINAATDTSDGVIGALLNLSEASGFGIELMPSSITIPAHIVNEASASNLSPWNLLFFCGDWQVEGEMGVAARVGSELCPVPQVRNENFKQTGFASNLDGHVRFMLETSLF